MLLKTAGGISNRKMHRLSKTRQPASMRLGGLVLGTKQVAATDVLRRICGTAGKF